MNDCRPSKTKAWTTRRIKEMEKAFLRAYAFALHSGPGYLLAEPPHIFVSGNGSFSVLTVVKIHGMNRDEADDFIFKMMQTMGNWGYLMTYQIIEDFLTEPLDNAEQDATLRA